jgi:hypothetical protein
LALNSHSDDVLELRLDLTALYGRMTPHRHARALPAHPSRLRKTMDCRVKLGNDGLWE